MRDDFPPRTRIADLFDIGADHHPERFGTWIGRVDAGGGKPFRHHRIGQLVHDLPVEHVEFRRIELRRRFRTRRRIECFGQCLQRRCGCNGFRRADQHRKRADGHRLVAILAQRPDRQGARSVSKAPRPSSSSAGCDGQRPAPSRRAPRTAAICAPVFVTWSSPRMTCVTPMSMSSTTDGSV